MLVAEPSEMPASARRVVGKTDSLDAVRIARSVLAVDTSRLRWPRAAGQRVVLRVLVVAREQMVTERTRAINALTALLRTIDLGVDTRKALPHRQFKVIAGWRDRREDSVVRTCRLSSQIRKSPDAPGRFSAVFEIHLVAVAPIPARGATDTHFPPRGRRGPATRQQLQNC